MGRCWIVVAFVAACGEAPEGGTAVSTTSGPDPGDTTTAATTSPSPATTSSESTTAMPTDGSSDDPVGGFLPGLDGGPTFECDTFAQDCAKGDKCTVWRDEGTSQLSTRCVPIAADPLPDGASCTVGDGPLSGIDDCEHGSVCWFVDADLQGTCVAFCHGSARAPTCDEGLSCADSSSGGAALCTPRCDPLGDECGDEICVPTGFGFWCVPDASSPGTTHGAPCETEDACPTTLACIGPQRHTTCEGGLGCCSTLCDLTAAVDPCPDLDSGQVCAPWFPPGQAPTGYEHVGVCAVPQE